MAYLEFGKHPQSISAFTKSLHDYIQEFPNRQDFLFWTILISGFAPSIVF